MKRFLLVSLLLVGLTVPLISHAQLDQKCWTRTDCETQRKILLNNNPGETDIKNGFIQDNQTEKACGGLKWGKNDVGFCLPAGQTETKISFGGETKFSDVGAFIKSMYRYIIWLSGILAAAMLIIAGFQWAASGGNSDAIGSAKKRIAGALSGLVLLLLSYVILNTVNPNLVNFRLPQIWLINTQGFAEYCSMLTEGDTVEYVGMSTEKISENTKIEKFKAGQFSTKPADAECGKQYVFSSGGGQSCRGSACQKGNVCIKKLDSKEEGCFVGNIGGVITNSSLTDSVINNADSWVADLLADGVTDFWEFPWVPDTGVLDNIKLLYVCNNGVLGDVDSSYKIDSSIKSATQFYTLSVSESALDGGMNQCTGNEGFKGFALKVDFNNPNDVVEDEAHVVGRTSSGSALDLGDMGVFRLFGGYDYSLPTGINKVASADLYMTKEQITKGINLNIDAARFCPVFNDQKDRVKCYGVNAKK